MQLMGMEGEMRTWKFERERAEAVEDAIERRRVVAHRDVDHLLWLWLLLLPMVRRYKDITTVMVTRPDRFV